MLRTALCLFVCATSSTIAFGATYHVATSGKDTNDGSSSKPWKTIQHACDAAAKGDNVLVHAGKYVGAVIVRRSMTLSAAPGEHPVIDGTGVVIPSDSAALVLVKDLDAVTVSGFEIANYVTTNSGLVPCGILVSGKADKIKLLGNKVHHIQNNGSSAGSINAFGIAIYGNSKAGAITNLLIDGNEIYDTKTGNSETLTVNGNVNGFQVSNNYVHDVDNIGIDCIGFEGTSPIAGQDFARSGLVTANRIVNVTSYNNIAYHKERSADGLYVDGGSDIILERNTVTGADIGIEVTSEHSGKYAERVTVRSNLVTASNTVGLSIGGYDHTRGGTKTCTFVNNTLYGNDTKQSGCGEFQIQFNTSGNVFENNILFATKQGVLIYSVTGAGSAIGLKDTRNLYFTLGDPTWVWNGKTYSSLPTFAKGSGGDATSLFENPSFKNIAKSDFSLAVGSPAINSGVSLSLAVRGILDFAGSSRVQGSAIDLGAYEYPTPMV